VAGSKNGVSVIILKNDGNKVKAENVDGKSKEWPPVIFQLLESTSGTYDGYQSFCPADHSAAIIRVLITLFDKGKYMII